MQETPGAEVTATEARERLTAAFVSKMVAGLSHVRRRENAVLYVRGLVAHGGCKSDVVFAMRASMRSRGKSVSVLVNVDLRTNHSSGMSSIRFQR